MLLPLGQVRNPIPLFTGANPGDFSRRSAPQNHLRGDTVFGQFGAQLQNLDRIAAQPDVVIQSADLSAVQHCLKAMADCLLQCICRSSVRCLVIVNIRRKQCFPIQLAVGVQRHSLKPLEEPGNHVIRHLFPQSSLDFLHRHRRFGNVIGHQIGLPIVILKALHHGIGNLLHPGNHRFDLLGFHPLAVDFHHPVLPVEIDDVPVFILFDHVAGVQPGSAIAHALKGPGRLLRQVPIASAHQADEAQLSWFPVRHLLSVFIQDKGFQIIGRLSDGGVSIFSVYRKQGDWATGFAQAVGIEDLIAA